MYTWEIDQLMKVRNYLLENDEYDKVCKTSPQIDHVKYRPFEDDFYIHTNDNYEVFFKVKKYVKPEN